MNTSATLAHLRSKRSAVSAWVGANEARLTADDPVLLCHVALWVRLDDAVLYMETRLARRFRVAS